MTYFIGIVVAALLMGVLLWTGMWWAAPLVLIALVVYMMRERSQGMATFERGRGPEPTGTPRSSASGGHAAGAPRTPSSGGDTANERVGQA